MDLTPILLAAQNPETQKAASDQLSALEAQNLPIYLVSLVCELGNDSKPTTSRQMAGIILKNQLNARSEAKQLQLSQQWMALDANVKNQVKTMVLQTLGSSSKEARHTAAMVLAKIAAIELPQNQWIEVLVALLENITKGTSQDQREASLIALGYICEETDADALTNQANAILTAVVMGLRAEETNNEIKAAAANALYNSLEFVKNNFENNTERDFIMKTICEATQWQADARVRQSAFECLAKIAVLYYDKLTPYMEAIYNITYGAVQKDVEDVGLQALEFWSSLSEVEAEIAEEESHATENDIEPNRKSFNFVKVCAPQLVKLLFETLVKQDEFQTEEDMNISSAAGTCLNLVARVVGDEIVQHTMPFIQQHINNPDWHFREAATLAFSGILDGPSSETIGPLVDQAVPIMLSHFNDAVTLVKDTTVWTVGRIAQLHPEPITEKYLRPVLEGLMTVVDSEARIASKACWALHNIAESFGTEECATYPLSPYFTHIFEKLLVVAERADVSEHNLRLNCYEALNVLMQTAAQDTYDFIQSKVTVLLQRLDATLKQGSLSQEDAEELSMVQGLLCGSLQVATTKLGTRIVPFADTLMEMFLRVMSNRAASVQEEALMAIGALANAVEGGFIKYMQAFMPFLLTALKNHEEDQVCTIAVGLIGDICGALGKAVSPFTDDIVSVLLTNLQSEALNRNVKPNIIAAFGDIALAIEGEFEKYLQYVAIVLQQASQAQVDQEDEEMVEYLNMLRENIFDAYSGILQGLKSEKAAVFSPYVDHLIQFLRVVAEYEHSDEEVFKNAVGVIGDLANVYGSKIKQVLNQQFITKMVNEAAKSDDPDIKQTGTWVKKQLKSL